jgi:hypothetical protein
MKKERTVFKKHILIPLALCLVVILTGSYMTITESVTYGQTKEYRYGQDKRSAKTINYSVTGPQTIAIGLIMGSIVTFIWAKTKK